MPVYHQPPPPQIPESSEYPGYGYGPRKWWKSRNQIFSFFSSLSFIFWSISNFSRVPDLVLCCWVLLVITDKQIDKKNRISDYFSLGNQSRNGPLENAKMSKVSKSKETKKEALAKTNRRKGNKPGGKTVRVFAMGRNCIWTRFLRKNGLSIERACNLKEFGAHREKWDYRWGALALLCKFDQFEILEQFSMERVCILANFRKNEIIRRARLHFCVNLTFLNFLAIFSRAHLHFQRISEKMRLSR